MGDGRGWNLIREGPPCALRVGVAVLWASLVISRAGGLAAAEIVPLPSVDPVQGKVEFLPPVNQPAETTPALPEPSESAWPVLDWKFLPLTGQGISGGPPGLTPYVIAEALAWQRNNQSDDVPLVTDTLTNETVLSVGDLDVPMGYGVRAFVGLRESDSWGCEAGYLGVYGMGTTRSVSGLENLRLAGPLSSLVPLPFEVADHVEATYSSIFQSAELNLFKSCSVDGGCGSGGADACSDCRGGTCCIDWLGGFRYVNLAEQAGLTFTCCTTEPVGPFTSSYDVQTSNNLFGGQFGGRGSVTWGKWAVESWAKAGVFANLQEQSQAPILDPINPGTPVRDARSTSGVQPAMLADLNVSVVYRLSRVFGLRVGYNALYVGSVALAPDQWDFGASDTSGTALAGNGGLFLNGVNFGVDAYW